MSVRRVLILGASGMLGSILVRWFSSVPGYSVTATTRNGLLPLGLDNISPAVKWVTLDAEKISAIDLAELFSGHDCVVNAIGLIKQRIRPNDLSDWGAALRVNSLFSVLLGEAAELSGVDVIQITTDCVYSGEKGHYSELDLHDATDVYGKSKSLGEIVSSKIKHLRCSIIGFELNSTYSLLNWFLSRPKDERISGYTNHLWNGITSLHFAKLCQGAIESGLALPLHLHVVPNNQISKCELLRLFRNAFGRKDIEIAPTRASQSVDRTLVTVHASRNEELWRNAGYQAPPSIEQMIRELAEYAESTE